MVVGVETAHVVVVVAQYHEDEIVFVELAEKRSVLIVVEAVNIRIPPHFSSTERGVSVALEAYTMHGFLGEQIAFG